MKDKSFNILKGRMYKCQDGVLIIGEKKNCEGNKWDCQIIGVKKVIMDEVTLLKMLDRYEIKMGEDDRK